MRPTLLVLVCAFLGAFLAGLVHLRNRSLILLEHSTPSIMGTTTTISVVVHRQEPEVGQRALDQAIAALRRVEARISSWIGTSEIAQLNAAPLGQPVPLSPDTLNLLLQARELTRQTQGAFDPTCRPLLRLWQLAQEQDQLPTEEGIAQARSEIGWQHFEFDMHSGLRASTNASIDLGGFGKGWAIDAALAALRTSDVLGGMIQCGGDLRTFGLNADREPWSLGIRNPLASAGVLLSETLQVTDQAVSTSGDYERTFRIQGVDYSHIIDPRSGRTVTDTPQVTVLAPTSSQADAWATALSVLGPVGLTNLPAGLEAMVVTGRGQEPTLTCSPGFKTTRD